MIIFWDNCYHLQVKERCRKGIPPSVRGQAWQHLMASNIKAKENPGLFDVSDYLLKLRYQGTLVMHFLSFFDFWYN
jgi:hypothetical protein